jgi:hypothetical protein
VSENPRLGVTIRFDSLIFRRELDRLRLEHGLIDEEEAETLALGRMLEEIDELEESP